MATNHRWRLDENAFALSGIHSSLTERSEIDGLIMTEPHQY